jgi:flagellar protein FlaG
MNINPIAHPAAEVQRPASVRTVAAAAPVSAVAAAADTQAHAADPHAVKEAVAAANEAVKAIKCELSFNIDEDTGKTVVRVVDTTTGKLIRQMPSPEILEIAKALDRLQGLLVRNSA